VNTATVTASTLRVSGHGAAPATALSFSNGNKTVTVPR
jgi:hypothetical protein